jgi:tagaturonate reductase
VPTELIPDNGTKLKEICLDLAKYNHLDVHFIKWLHTANDFCNSLVDRIVSGNEKAHTNGEVNSKVIGDALAIVSEPYSLWAIETSSDRTKQILSFSKADENIVLAENIERYRELKLRLLNGAHTFSCGLAILSGFRTVKEAMENKFFESFLSNLMHDEISKAILSKDIKEADAKEFTDKVLDRFRNPFIDHLWVSITKQYTSKMLMRNIPSLLAYYQRLNRVPEHMAIGFCSYILFMHSEELEIGKYSGKINGEYTLIHDAKASILNEKWAKSNLKETVKEILSDSDLWHADLTQLPGFEKTVYEYVIKFMDQMALQPQSSLA